jgi:hypothetical protein
MMAQLEAVHDVQGIGDALRSLRPAADADPAAYPLQT